MQVLTTRTDLQLALRHELQRCTVLTVRGAVSARRGVPAMASERTTREGSLHADATAHKPRTCSFAPAKSGAVFLLYAIVALEEH